MNFCSAENHLFFFFHDLFPDLFDLDRSLDFYHDHGNRHDLCNHLDPIFDNDLELCRIDDYRSRDRLLQIDLQISFDCLCSAADHYFPRVEKSFVADLVASPELQVSAEDDSGILD